MDRSQISPALMKARGRDIAKIPLAAMKTISSPGELGMRLNAYDALVAKARRPHLEAGLLAGYHQLATEVLTTEDRARAVELMKTAGTAPHYSPPEMQRMLRTGTACKLTSGHICPVGNVRDLRYQVTIAQGAMGRGTPEDSAAFRSFLVSRARFLGVPNLIPQDWGRPAAQSSAVAAGKSAAARPATSGALAKALPRSVTVPTPALDDLGKSRSLNDGMNKLIEQGRLHQAAAELAAVDAASRSLRGQGKAAIYLQKAKQVSDPVMAQAYREMARAEAGEL